jgi:hypothetical protein
VPCQLVPRVLPLVSGSCASPHTCAPRCLQTPPRDDALARPVSFGSTYTWTGDFRPPSTTTWPAHPGQVQRRGSLRPLQRAVRPYLTRLAPSPEPPCIGPRHRSTKNPPTTYLCRRVSRARLSSADWWEPCRHSGPQRRTGTPRLQQALQQLIHRTSRTRHLCTRCFLPLDGSGTARDPCSLC